MSRLEKVKHITDFETIKSYNYPYVAMDENKQLCYSPVLDHEIITHDSKLERYIDGPCEFTFYIPNIYESLKSSSSISFFPEYAGLESPKFNIYGSSTLYSMDGVSYNHYYNINEGYNAQMLFTVYDYPTLVKCTLLTHTSGMVVISLDTNVYNTIFSTNILLNDNIINLNISQFILFKNNFKNNYKSNFVIWESELSALLLFGSYKPESSLLGSTFLEDTIDLQPNTPIQIYDKINSIKDFYKYCELHSTSSGVLKFVDIITPDDAEFIKHGDILNVSASDLKVYCWHKNVKLNTLFKIIGANTVTLSVSNTSEFLSENYLWLYTMDVSNDNNFYLTSADFGEFTTNATSDYIYIKFEPDNNSTILIDEITFVDNTGKSILLNPNSTYEVERSTKSLSRHFRYSDIKNKPLSLKHNSSSKMKIYIANKCSFTLSSTSKNVLEYAYINNSSKLDISSETVNSWEEKLVDKNFVFTRFDISKDANVYISQSIEE